MATRIGIELSPVDCRIVEIDTAGGRGGADAVTSIRSLSVSPKAIGETRSQLARLRGCEAAVVAWGLRGDHRQAVVRADRYDAMRSEAITSLGSAGVDTRGVAADIAPAGPRVNDGARRPVVMAVASRKDIAEALRPLKEAGIRIRSVVTPASALCSIARMRRKGGAPTGVEAYLALEETATCIALVRDCALLAARELPWGYVQEQEPFGERVPRDKIAIRLAGELTEFLASAGVKASSVTTVNICGTLPDLRSMTAPMMELLEVEVEPLDSMFGVDSGSLSEAAAEFRERGVELRLAWAVAADWRAPLNLLRERRHRASASIFARAAVVAGVGVGLGLGWMLQQTAWLEASSRPAHIARPAPIVHRPAAAAAPLPEPVETPQPPPAIVQEPPVDLIPIAEPPAALVASAEPLAPAAIQASEAPAVVEAPPEAQTPPRVREVARRTSAAPITDSASELGSILFGPERKLALIDGRIVEAGDEVKDGTVVEIGPTNVTVRDARGRIKKLSLGLKKR